MKLKLREKTTATLLIAIFMISTLAIVMPVSAAVPEVWVDDSYETEDATHFKTIQGGIDAVAVDGTVHVFAGTYMEWQDVSVFGIGKSTGIMIDKSLTVVSVDGAEVTIIDAQEADMGVLINGEGTIATFDGFTVENYDTAGILAGAFGYWGEDPHMVHILNNIVKDPTIEAPHNNNIQIGDGTTGTVIGNEVFGAFLTSPDWSGSGILVAGSSDVLISNNYVHDCEGGIQIVGYEDYRNAPAVDNIIEYNLVEDSECGISVQMKSTGTIIRFNDVLYNDEGIAVMAIDYSWEQSTPSGTEIHYNNIVGNTDGVLSSIWGSHTGNVPIEHVDATLNWWGHASGPSGPDGRINKAGKVIGKGDSVSDNVDWDQWLPQPVFHTPNHPVPPGLE